MGYVLDGTGINSAECRALKMKYYKDIEQDSNVPGVLLLDAKDAYIEYDGPENQHRPYLTIVGRPAGIQADLPYHVSTLRYQDARDRQLVSYRYDFSRENLAVLAQNGLFEKGFAPSKLAKTSRYELPCEISYVAFPPDAEPSMAASFEDHAEFRTQNPPVVFASLQVASLHCDDETSGYCIHDYFEPLPEKTVVADKDYSPVNERVLGNEFEDAFESPEPIHFEPAPIVLPEPVEPAPPAYEELLSDYQVGGEQEYQEPEFDPGENVFSAGFEGAQEPSVSEVEQEPDVQQEEPPEPVSAPEAMSGANSDRRGSGRRGSGDGQESSHDVPKPFKGSRDTSDLDAGSSGELDMEEPEYI